MLSLAIHDTTERRASDHPPPPYRFNNEGAKGDACVRALRCGVQESSLTGLYRGENASESCRIRGGWSEPEGTRDREVPRLGARQDP